MSFFSYRCRTIRYRDYVLFTMPSRLHSQRELMAAIRRHDPFQGQS